jgi:flagellar FliL protein
MAEQDVENVQQEPEVENDPNSGGAKSVLAKAKLLVFAGVVVVVECVIAYLYLPSAAESSVAAAADTASEIDPEALLEVTADEQAPAVEQVEVDLGEYSVTSYQPRSNTTLRIDFHLYGTINKDDQAAFDQAMAAHQHRVRDQVIVTIRSSELSDLTDAGLGLIKRKILGKSNETFEKYLLQSIIFSDFSFIEQ